MRSINITSKTEAGKKALEKSFEKYDKVKYKIVLRTAGIKFEITHGEPTVLSFIFAGKLKILQRFDSSFDKKLNAIVKEHGAAIEKELAELGAKKGKDYTLDWV